MSLCLMLFVVLWAEDISMVGYGNDLFFATDSSLVKKKLSLEYMLNNSDAFKSLWLEYIDEHRNQKVYDKTEVESKFQPAVQFKPFLLPSYDSLGINVRHRSVCEFGENGVSYLAKIAGCEYIYRMNGWFDFFYDLKNDWRVVGGSEILDNRGWTIIADEDDFCEFSRIKILYKYFERFNKCIFECLLKFICDRFETGSKVNKIIYSFHGTKPFSSQFEISNFDIDKIEIPNDNYKYLNKEFFERKVDFDGGNNFVYNFYKVAR